MKIRAAEMVLGYRYQGHEVVSIARGVGGIFVTTTADLDRPRWIGNEDRIEVNDW